MGKRFAILIGVAATGVMALGAQTASAGVVKYDTKLTVTKDRAGFYHGKVKSEVIRKCERGRRVVLFKRRPGADRRLGSARSDRRGNWKLWLDRDIGTHVWAKVKPKVRDRFVCRADRAAFSP